MKTERRHRVRLSTRGPRFLWRRTWASREEITAADMWSGWSRDPFIRNDVKKKKKSKKVHKRLNIIFFKNLKVFFCSYLCAFLIKLNQNNFVFFFAGRYLRRQSSDFIIFYIFFPRWCIAGKRSPWQQKDEGLSAVLWGNKNNQKWKRCQCTFTRRRQPQNKPCKEPHLSFWGVTLILTDGFQEQQPAEATFWNRRPWCDSFSTFQAFQASAAVINWYSLVVLRNQEPNEMESKGTQEEETGGNKKEQKTMFYWYSNI